MQKDFHYYATYCAAYLAGYSHEESLAICYADQFTDVCTVTLLQKIHAPISAATTQLQSELVNHRVDLVGLQEITRIWSAFHFLPYDLNAPHKVRSKRYLNKYRLICKPNGKLVKRTVMLAKNKGLPAVGLAMHVLADTWAHSYFAGTPSYVINNTDSYFYELLGDDASGNDAFGNNASGNDASGNNSSSNNSSSNNSSGNNAFGEKRKIEFNNNPSAGDNLEKSIYTNSLHRTVENTIMNLGHGRAGHLPDYSFIRYEYMPAWGNYEIIVKDNPSDYYHAFCQMIQAMLYLRGEIEEFNLGEYAFARVAPWEERIRAIIKTRQLDACEDWKALGEELSGQSIPDFDIDRYQNEYMEADSAFQDDTYLGQFILAAMNQKSMVTGEIFRTGNLLAGFAIDYQLKGFRGIRDYRKLLNSWKEEKS